ncbi:MAG: diaminopimelate decarboxylase [Candidatus Obscuribacterales bacterium]|nr:diaminopimelate decarboxylase [Candidatus Obscuribacterales bacterium]
MTTSMIKCPNTSIWPLSARANADQHLEIGGCDATELARQFGTPLWVMDYDTIVHAAEAAKRGISSYPKAQILYAGKAFLCLAMCHIVRRLGLGIDVVSEGELYTALQAGCDPQRIYLHGNNKSESELNLAISRGVKIVVNGPCELKRVAEIGARLGLQAQILVRVTPGVEPDTHHHIKTGQVDSKFGIELSELEEFVVLALANPESVRLTGLHAHIGSQSHDIQPYLASIDILADQALALKQRLDFQLEVLDVGGGLGIAYTKKDKPLPIFDWAQSIATRTRSAFEKRGLELPELLLEPGRAIVGPAGLTLYKAGDVKALTNGGRYVALDGGMADNPRPVTYNAAYTAAIANRLDAQAPDSPTTLVGRYCESGDIIIKDAGISADTGDIIAVFATGAYNYSMASNYNRTGRPACVLVHEGIAEVILERETCEDLLKQDRVPGWLLKR